MTQKMALKLHDTDNVAVCTSEISVGDIVAVVAPDGARTEVKAVSDIAFCNKIALQTIAEGDVILKYGETIGRALTGIPIGALADHLDILPSLKAEDSWIKHRMPTFVGLTPAFLDGRTSRPLLLCQQCEALPQEYCGPHSRHGHAPHHSAGMSTDVLSDLSCLQI